MNISPDLSLSSYVQYDTVSESVGTNTRLRWTFLPVADLFVVYNHNIRSMLDRWRLDSNQLLIKLEYAWRLKSSSRRVSRHGDRVDPAVPHHDRAVSQRGGVSRVVRHADHGELELPTQPCDFLP